MPRIIKDSYTHEPYVEDYKSQIPGINEPRSFYKNVKGSIEYKATQLADGSWLVTRKNAAASLFPPFYNEETARAVLDWLVRNDASVAIAIHWFNRGNLAPMFALFDLIAEIIRGH